MTKQKQQTCSAKLKQQQEKRVSYATQKWGPQVYARFHQDELKMRDQRLIEHIAVFDPTPNRQFLGWLCQRYCAGEFKLLNADTASMHTLLQWFQKARQVLLHADIQQYTLKELQTWHKQIGEVTGRREAERKMRAHLYQGGYAQLIVDHPNGRVIELKTFSAMQYYGRGTRWCVTDAETFREYTQSGHLYLLLWRREKYLISINQENPMDIEMANSRDEQIIRQGILQRYEKAWPRFLAEIIIALHLSRHGLVRKWWPCQLPLVKDATWVNGYWGEMVLRNTATAQLLASIGSARHLKRTPRVSGTLRCTPLTEAFILRFPHLGGYLQ